MSMHICFIEDTPLHGGTQIWVVDAVREFLRRGADVTLLAPAGSWVTAQCSATAARIVTYDWDAVTAQDRAARRTWSDALAPADVALCTVHPPRAGFHCARFAAACIAESRLPTCLVTKTGTIVPSYRREFYLPDERLCSAVITITDFTRRYLLEHYHLPPARVTTLYQGVDLRRFRATPALREEARRRYPVPPGDGPVLAVVGSFEPRKGQTILLDALSSLPEARALLVGDGPDKPRLQEHISRLGLADRAALFPFTTRPELIYARADLTVLPSLYKEGLPNVLLESMAMGVPVIASRLGGVPEIVRPGETGVLVPRGDAAALAEAIRRLWEDRRTYERVRRQAQHLMATHFNRRAQFGKFLTFLGDL